MQLLAAPDGGGGQILVQAGLEDHVMPVKELACLHQLLIIAPQRRAAIARDEPPGVQPRRAIPPDLRHGQSDKGLRARHEDGPGLGGIFVVQRNGHARPPSGKSGLPDIRLGQGRGNRVAIADRIAGWLVTLYHNNRQLW